MDTSHFATIYSPELISAVAGPIFSGTHSDWQDAPFSHPLLAAWIEDSVEIVARLTPAELASLPPQTKRGLATATLCCCQSIMGLNVDDLTLKSGSDDAYQGYLENLRKKTADNCSADPERLVAAFALAEKASIALGRSEYYDDLIERSAQVTAGSINRYKPEFHEWGFNEHGYFAYGFLIAATQAWVWKDAEPALFEDITDFRVFAAPPGEHPNRYFREPDGSGFFFIDRNSDDKWEECPERSGWLIAHEHLHHVQRHMLNKLENGKLSKGHALYEDACNLDRKSEYGVLTIGNSILPKTAEQAPGKSVWFAVHDALYLANPDELAAFKLHNRIQELLDPSPKRPALKPATAAPSPARR